MGGEQEWGQHGVGAGAVGEGVGNDVCTQGPRKAGGACPPLPSRRRRPRLVSPQGGRGGPAHPPIPRVGGAGAGQSAVWAGRAGPPTHPPVWAGQRQVSP